MGDLHADALEVLSTWQGDTPDQEALRQRFVEHLRAHPAGMTRAQFPDHLTAGMLVLDTSGEHVLLNLHRKAQRWFAFGGHCEPDDRTLLGAALREAREESGLSDLEVSPTPVGLDEHAVEFCDPRGTVHHLDVRFTARVPAGSVPAVSEESLSVRWWPVAALPEDLEDEMRDLIARSVARWA